MIAIGWVLGKVLGVTLVSNPRWVFRRSSELSSLTTSGEKQLEWYWWHGYFGSFCQMTGVWTSDDYRETLQCLLVY